MQFYHLTTEDIAAKIVEQGTLKSSYGSNNLLCGEDKPCVFFCDEASVPYWAILLRRTTAIPFTLFGYHPMCYFNYGLYSEFYLHDDIRIRTGTPILVTPDESIYKQLRERYISILSSVVVRGLRADVNPEFWIRDVFGVISVTERLEFKNAPASELTKVLRDIADDGDYTFLDTYNNQSLRCYQQLLNIDSPVTMLACEMLYDTIVRNFSSVLDTDTGGIDIR